MRLEETQLLRKPSGVPTKSTRYSKEKTGTVSQDRVHSKTYGTLALDGNLDRGGGRRGRSRGKTTKSFHLQDDTKLASFGHRTNQYINSLLTAFYTRP